MRKFQVGSEAMRGPWARMPALGQGGRSIRAAGPGPELAAAVPDSDSGVAAEAQPISVQSPSRGHTQPHWH